MYRIFVRLSDSWFVTIVARSSKIKFMLKSTLPSSTYSLCELHRLLAIRFMLTGPTTFSEHFDFTESDEIIAPVIAETGLSQNKRESQKEDEVGDLSKITKFTLLTNIFLIEVH